MTILAAGRLRFSFQFSESILRFGGREAAVARGLLLLLLVFDQFLCYFCMIAPSDRIYLDGVELVNGGIAISDFGAASHDK